MPHNLYFKNDINNFGIILRGKSLEKYPEIYKQYKSCLIVNNFDKEIENYPNYYIKKDAVHLVNRLRTAICSRQTYNKTNIKNIIFSKSREDGNIKQVIPLYKKLNLYIHFMPEYILNISSLYFGDKYKERCPNTGFLGILYICQHYSPKDVWIIGLDFYQTDYLTRRPWQNPLKIQQEKIKEINMIDNFIKLINNYPNTMFHVITYYDKLPKLQNLEVL